MGGSTAHIDTKSSIIGEIAGVVGKIAPVLGTVLGSPLAGVGISLLSQLFGVKTDDLDGLLGKINETPESAIKIKTLEYEHIETLAKIASTDYSTEVDDRKDARKNSVLYKDFLRHMAYLVTFGFFAALFVLFLPLPINGNERELLSMLVGMLVSKWQTIIDFFYGSSRVKQQGGSNE